MDNKQDRQLYWEVKQFFQGTPNMVPPPVKTSSLRDVAASVMNENKPFSQAKPQSHSNVFDATGSMLNAMKSLEAKNNPGHIAYTKNGSTNPFNLNESQTRQNKVEQYNQNYIVGDTRFGTPSAPTMPADGILTGRDGRKVDLKTSEFGSTVGGADSENQINPAINAQREENRFNSRPDRYVPMGELRSGVLNTGAVIPSLSQQANAPQAPYQPAVPYEQQTDRPTPARTDRLPVKTPGTPAPTSTAPGTAPATPAPTSAAPGTAPVTPAPTGTAPPSRVPAKNTPYVRTYTSSEPTSTNAPNDNTYLPNRNENGARVTNPRATQDKASDNPEQYEDKGMILNKPTFKVSNPITMPKFASSNTSMGNRTSGGPSAGQYRGNSNMGMAPGPQRQEKQTLQSVMAQQNQKATSDSLGQMGSVQSTQPTASGNFQNSVLPPMNSLGSPRTTKTNEFKYSSGSRLS